MVRKMKIFTLALFSDPSNYRVMPVLFLVVGFYIFSFEISILKGVVVL